MSHSGATAEQYFTPPFERRLRFVLIIRTSKRKKEAKSPQQQRDIAEAWRLAHGHEIVAVLDSGKDESGKTMDRSTTREAMEMVRRDEADGVLFALTDRLGRAPIEESMTWIRSLNLIGHLALADAGGAPINLGEPSAETNLVLQLQMARQYWLATARRFRQSQRDANLAGRYNGPTPIGFRRDKGRLKEGDRAAVITEAYRLAATKDIHAAAAYLKREVPGRRWDTDQVRGLLANRAYLGENVLTLHADPVNGFDAEVLVSPKPHVALTTQEMFDNAQTEPHMRRSNGEYPLSHLVQCGYCGSGLVGGLQTFKGRDYSYRRMRCADCARCSVNADDLEVYVRETVAAMFDVGGFRLSLEPQGKDNAQAVRDTAKANLQAAVRQAARPASSRLRQEMADAEVDEAEHAYLAAEKRLQEIAAAAEDHAELPTGDEIRTDDAQLARAIRIGVRRITVGVGQRGRRVDIEDRITAFVFVGSVDDLDDGPGVLAA